MAIDNNPSAIECTETNARIYGFGDSINAKLMDLTDFYTNKKLFEERSEEKVINLDSNALL